jgi:C-terminal peptidase prc
MAKVMCKGLLVGLFLAAVASAPLRAAEVQPQPQSKAAYVVLVGIDKYADSQIKGRTHAEADAQAFYDLFTNKDYLGADAKHIRLLLGSTKDDGAKSEPATHANILKALHWAVHSAHKDDLLIFGFFGQGAPLGERTCYFASDSTFKNRAKDALAAGEIEHELHNLKSQHFCAFVDVNFNGFDIGKETAPGLNVENRFKEFMRSDVKETFGDDEVGPLTGRVLFLASDGLSTTLDLKDHSAFAQVLLNGLKGAADKEGYEPDGVVTVDELATYLHKELPGLVFKHGKTKEEKEQIPIVLGARANHFDLTRNPAVTPKVEARLAKLEKLAKDDKITKDLAEEGHTLLSHMPKLKAQQDLRKEYQRLADGAIAAAEFSKAREDILSATKLKRKDALDYAEKVMEAAVLLRKNYVKELNPGEMVDWGIHGLYRSANEKVPADVLKRLTDAKSLKEADLTVLLADAREQLGKREDLSNGKDVDLTLQHMTFKLDPYTTYIDPETLHRFNTEIGGKFTGIGVQIRKDTGRDMLRVVTPIKDSPAYKKGIKAGDIITTITRYVDDQGRPLDEPEVISTKGMTTNDAVKKILGKAKTKVKLTIDREGASKPLEFEIVRGSVEVETVLGVKRNSKDDSWDFLLDPEKKIYYVRLTQFTRGTYRDLAELMHRFDKEKIGGLVLDLRFNPGGTLESAVRISDLFIDDGLIVTIKPRKDVEDEEVHRGHHEGSYLKFPMAVLINGGSASASEIVSACLQDHKRAVIVGERSYGKGSVQRIHEFSATGGLLKLTTATYWRPNGKNINKSSTKGGEDDEWGVTPDGGYVLKLNPKERDELAEHQRDQEIIPNRELPVKDPKPEFKDRQLDKALDYLNGQIKMVARVPTKKAG